MTSLFVIGEIAMGRWKRRAETLFEMGRLPLSVAARNEEVLRFVDEHHLYGAGLSFSDMHLLASTPVTPACLLWTRDRRLLAAAQDFSVESHLV